MCRRYYLSKMLLFFGNFRFLRIRRTSICFAETILNIAKKLLGKFFSGAEFGGVRKTFPELPEAFSCWANRYCWVEKKHAKKLCMLSGSSGIHAYGHLLNFKHNNFHNFYFQIIHNSRIFWCFILVDCPTRKFFEILWKNFVSTASQRSAEGLYTVM